MTAPAKPISSSEPDLSTYIEDFRRAGHEAVDWIASYLAGVRDMPVLATASAARKSSKNESTSSRASRLLSPSSLNNDSAISALVNAIEEVRRQI